MSYSDTEEIPLSVPKTQPKKRRGKEPIEPGMLDCPHCTYIATTKTGLLNHVRKHLIQPEYKCSLCQAKFDSNKELLDHKLVHKDEKRSFLCKKCEMAFTEQHDWLQHEFTHTFKSAYKCPECTRYFKAKSAVQKHLSSHFDLSYECDICGEVLKSEVSLEEHVNVHERIFECCECGSVCKSKNHLDSHMLIHTGVRPFQCLYCGKGFINAAGRIVHTRTHTADQI